MSASPDISSVAASNSPVMVKFLCPVVSMFASVVTTLEAIAVPAVRPSNSSNSASARTALPAVNPVPVTIPVEVIAPEPIVPARSFHRNQLFTAHAQGRARLSLTLPETCNAMNILYM